MIPLQDESRERKKTLTTISSMSGKQVVARKKNAIPFKMTRVATFGLRFARFVDRITGGGGHMSDLPGA